LWAAPYWNLGNFQPETLDTQLIRAGLENLAYERKLRCDFEVRAPGRPGSAEALLNPQKYNFNSQVVANWHHDGGTLGDKYRQEVPDFYILVWSNVAPTDITPYVQQWDSEVSQFVPTPSGETIKSEPGDLIAFSNRVFKHRVPKVFKTVAKIRWFGRAFVRPRETYQPDNYQYAHFGQLDIGIVRKQQEAVNQLKYFEEQFLKLGDRFK